jgi:subtilisin-like proprotein convertase family protein
LFFNLQQKIFSVMKNVLTTCIALLSATLLWGQSAANFWKDVSLQQIWLPENAVTATMPMQFRALSLDFDALRNHLRVAPAEGSVGAKSGALRLQLPMPDGSMQNFRVWDSPVMAPELAAKYPMIRSYAGRSLDNPKNIVRLGYGPTGFHAMIIGEKGGSIITSYASNQTQYYICYSKLDISPEGLGLPSYFPPDEEPYKVVSTGEERGNLGGGCGELAVLRTYRFALAATGEYSFNHGNTKPTVLATLVEATSALNAVLERDADMRLELVPNNDTIIFIGASTDPYNPANNGGSLLGQNETILGDYIGNANFDVGHVFTQGCTDVGGVVNGQTCGAGKARGVTCHAGGTTSNVIAITLQIAAHEMAHQFTGCHTFNNCPGAEDQYCHPAAFEPGSGSTLLSYAGLCGPSNVQGSSDVYYHGSTVLEYWTFTHGGFGDQCPVKTTTSNRAPNVQLPYTNGFYIPISTPFELEANATDADGDPLTYCWEQINNGPSVSLGQPAGNSPLFRSFEPTEDNWRVFPRLPVIVQNSTDIREVLPTYTRNLSFRCTVRDNNTDEGAGGICWQDVSFEATNTAGPFRVQQPNTAAITWEVGDYVEVKWDVANTNTGLVNSPYVNIFLSTDGGFTYPVTLLENTPNDGSAFVVVPDQMTTTARVKVKGAGHIFFDISNANFSIVPPAEPTYIFQATPDFVNTCLPDAVSFDIETSPVQGFNAPVTLSVSGLPAGAVPTFSANPVTPGNTSTLTVDMSNVTASGNFNVTISGDAAGTPTANRNVTLRIVSSDFSAIQLTGPADGSSGQTSLPTFQWTASPNATSYNFEISASPTFDPLLDSATDITSTSYTPAVSLADNTAYYWRISANNECGTGIFSDAATLHTVSQSCQTKQSTTEDITISATGTPVVSKVINVAQSGSVSDVNVRNVTGQHLAIGHLELRLKGPDGTIVKLMSALPCASSQFNVGFNDQAPAGNPPCPPNTGQFYQPKEPLSAFNGKNSLGDWTLEVAVINNDGEGGKFNSWSLEYCASSTPQNPFLVTNDTICVKPGDDNIIFSDKLVVSDPDNDGNELTFVMVTNTKYGFVSRSGVPLGVGSTFTMGDIYSSKMRYTNTDASAEYDYFTFAVSDGTGGWFGTPRVYFKVDPGCIVGDASDLTGEAQVIVYPNPAKDRVFVEFPAAPEGKATVSLINSQGQTLQIKKFDAGASKLGLNTGNMPAGLYYLQIETAEGLLTKKLIIGK